MLRILLRQHFVPVPVANTFPSRLIRPVEQLHKPHALLHQPPRQDAVLRIRRLQILHRIPRRIRSIHLQNMRRLTRNIRHLRHRQLHPRRQLITRNPRRQLRIPGILLKVMPVQSRQKLPRRTIIRLARHRRTRNIPNRPRRVEIRPLKRRRQIPRSPEIPRRLRCPARIRNRHVRRQGVVLRPQRIRHPRPHARIRIQRVPRRHEVLPRPVRVRLPSQRMNETHVVHHRPQMRHQIRHHLPALPIRPELPRALRQHPLLPLKRDQLLSPRHRLPVILDQIRLVIKGVYLTHRPGTEYHQHVLRPRLKMRLPRRIRIRRIDLRPDRRRRHPSLPRQQLRQRNPAQPRYGLR